MSVHNVEYIINMRDKMSRKMNRLERRSKSLNKTFLRMGSSLGLTFGAGMLARDAFRTMTQYEDKMQEVKTLTQATGDQFAQLSAEAQSLGGSTIFSATQVADAMGYLSKAGFDTREILQSTSDTLSLAAAGGIDLANASDIASDALTAMGMQADELQTITDDFATVANNSNTTVQLIGDSFRYAAATARSAGADVKELTAAVGFLGDAGIKGSMAGTQLRQVYAKLMTKSAQKKMENYGVDVKNANDELVRMPEILKRMQQAGFGAEEALDVFGTRAGTAVQILLQRGGEALEKYVKKLDNNLGEAERIAKGKTDSLAKDLTMLESAWDGLVLSIEDGSGAISSGLRSATQGITGFLNKAAAMNKTADDFGKIWGSEYVDQVIKATEGMDDQDKIMGTYQKKLIDYQNIIQDLKKDMDKYREDVKVLGMTPQTVLSEGFLQTFGLMGREEIEAKRNLKVTQGMITGYQKAIQKLKRAMASGRVLGGGGAGAGGDGTPDGADGDKGQPQTGTGGVEGRTITGSAPRYFTINIENLVDDGINLQVSQLDESLPTVRDKVLEALTEALNDITLAQTQ